MKKLLKALAAYLARSRVMRSLVGNLIYPAVVDSLRDEVQPDVVSQSGVVEAFAWKTHAYLVLNEELRATGRDCSMGTMRCGHDTRARLIDTVIACAAGTEGDILEFGVYKGESLLVFAELCPDRHVYGFDSFDGLPETWWTRPKGTFKTEPPNIDKPNVTLIKGSFEETLPRFCAGWSERAAIVHVDCDLYKSACTCLLRILPRCKVGTVVLFDEYYNYPDFASHEWLAWREIRAMYRMTAPCIAYDGRRAAFQITHLGELAMSNDYTGVSSWPRKQSFCL